MSKHHNKSKTSKLSYKHNSKAQKTYNNHHHEHETFVQKKITNEKIEQQSSLKCGDPMTILFFSLMLTATAYGTYNYMNQNHWTKDMNTKVPDSSKSSMTSSNLEGVCKTAIFYESHHDSAPVKFVDQMLPTFAKSNYTTFLFEEPKGMSLDQNIAALHSGIGKLSKMSTSNFPQKTKFIDSFKATASLLSNIKEQGLIYVAVDMDETSRKKLNFMDSNDPHNIKARDKFMAASIDKACKEYKADQVFIVGAMHGGIAPMLKEAGHQITSSYIIHHEPILDPSFKSIGRADNDIMLRTGNSEYMQKYGYEGMHIVNFYDGTESDAMANLTGVMEELELTT